MDFTGERYMPILPNAEITYEHWHRYVFTQQFIADKIVLDVACGEGYGSFYMAAFAKEVIGVDISEEAVTHAAGAYKKDNLRFIQSNAAAIPLSENGIADVVVSFETIEHLDETHQHRFLTEIKRLLKPDGILLISTPDKLLYTDIPGYKNQYHIREFYGDAFSSFLENYFPHVVFFRQKLFPVSLIWNDAPEGLQMNYMGIGENGFQLKNTFAATPMYLLGVCSNMPVPISQPSVLIDENATLLKELNNDILAKQKTIESLQIELLELKEKHNLI